MGEPQTPVFIAVTVVPSALAEDGLMLRFGADGERRSAREARGKIANRAGSLVCET